MKYNYDYVILGGGITGVAFARLLQLSGCHSFLILEADSEPGGLCKTKKIGNHYLDTGGGHFLCTKHTEVYDFVFHHLPVSEFNFFGRVSKISIADVEIDYPLESNIWQLPAQQCAEYLVSVVRNGEARGLPSPANFEAWCRWKLGDKITDEYMLPYNKKIWGLNPEEMDTDWLHKIPRLNVDEIVRACLERKPDSKKMPSHAGFYYPKNGGFQGVFDAICKPVAQSIETRVAVSQIEVEGGSVVINGKYRTARLINTVPWITLIDSPVFSEHIRTRIRELRSNSIVVSLHEETLKTNAHWIYEPSLSLAHHRSFYIHNFAPHSDTNGVYRETNRKRWDTSNGSIYSHDNEFAYPVPALGWAKATKELLEYCRQRNIYGLGRWGQWEYFNSDVCIHEAMKLCESFGLHGWRDQIRTA